MRKLTSEQFLQKVAGLHENLQILSEYNGMRSRVKLKCTIVDDIGHGHGEYTIRAGDLINQGRGCQKCANVIRSAAQTKYTHDKNFFAVPNLINSYWAGFIAADGCVDDTSHLAINLKKDDMQHLEKMMNAISYDGVLYHKDRFFLGKKYSTSYLYISNAQKLIHDLRINFNISPRKSRTLVPPSGLSEKNQLAYIKGYIDGDGHIRVDGPRYRIGACGTKAVIDWIRKWFDRISLTSSLNNLASNVRQQNNVFVYEVAYGRAFRIIEFLRTIQTPHLKRKWGHD